MEIWINKGELSLFTTGDYDSYRIIDLLRAKVRFDLLKMRATYLEIYPDQATKYGFNNDKFIDYLIDVVNVVEEVDFTEFNLDYILNKKA